jgi:hypothetical protein
MMPIINDKSIYFCYTFPKSRYFPKSRIFPKVDIFALLFPKVDNNVKNGLKNDSL